MPNPIAKHLAVLPNLDRPAIQNLWKELFGSAPPSHLRRDLMIPILAYRIQERAFGSLNALTRRRLRQLGKAFEKDHYSTIPFTPKIKPGTRLVRQWGGQVHLVNVKPNGYEYKGGHYNSLSRIARLITGTRWSGPLFFGINGDQSRQAKETR
jgi:hypothetical protein